MENFLRSKEYWVLIEKGIPVSTEGSTVTDAEQKKIDEAKLKDLKCKNYLFQAIDRATLETILNKDTSKEIWESLKRKFQGNARARRSTLQAARKEFEGVEMKSSETISDYIPRVMQIANKMRIHGDKMEDGVIVEKILRSLCEKYNYMACSIAESKDTEKMSVDEVHSSLLIHEQNYLRFAKNRGEDHVLKATTQERGHSSTGNRGRGSSSSRGRGRGRQQRETVECFKCKKLGHYRNECPEWDKEASANCAETDDEDLMLLMACADGIEEETEGMINDEMVCNSDFMDTECDDDVMLLMTGNLSKEEEMEQIWFLDSGCSNHMSGDKKSFINLDESIKKNVKLGNGMNIQVAGKGSIKVKMNGMSHLISNVYYVPELKNNLLSIGQLQENGLTVLFKGGEGNCKVYHPEKGLILESKVAPNRMYKLLGKSIKEKISTESACFHTSIEDMNYLWHCRLGHLSNKGMITLQKQQLVRGLPKLTNDDRVCTDCMRGKQHRDPIPKKSNWRAKEKLELIHADVCGPITPISSSNKRYILCLIDDYSRKAWIYFMSEKSESFTHFKAFKSRVEMESGLKIKCLRTDRGGEFVSSEFNQFCVDVGIKRNLTTAYTPQQNGVVERKNRTLMNMVRSILSCKSIPKKFWPEAAKWSVYVLNRCPTLSLKNKTPEEAWSGNKPTVEHFKVFGCVGHVHVPEKQRSKLEDKSKKCILLGVSEESKGYRMYDPIGGKIIVSRDVVFEENEEWDWSGNTNNSQPDLIDDLNWEENESNADVDETESVVSESSENEASTNGDMQNTDSNNDATFSNNDDDELIDEDSSNDETETVINNETRERRPPVWLGDYETNFNVYLDKEQLNLTRTENSDPECFEIAVKENKWREAMDVEIASIVKNETWELVDLPPGSKVIGVKWIYKTKLNELGEIDKFKARLVAKGYTQKQGIDYTEVFAPVSRLDTIRLIIATAAQKGWSLFQLDVKSAFLYGKLDEEVFVEQPKGYVVKGSEAKVYKLHKALYGLKQAPRAWFSRIEAYFLQQGFTASKNERTLFFKEDGNGGILIVSIYVDDLIYTGNSLKMMNDFKSSMKNEFSMTDLGKMKYFLGIEVTQQNDFIHISQRKYTLELLNRFDMVSCNSVLVPMVPGTKVCRAENDELADETVYKQLIGSLIYITATRPDIMYAVSLLSRYMSKPSQAHMMAAKRVLRYLQGTADFGIKYKKGNDCKITGFTDSDYAGDLEERKSTSGYVFLLSEGAIAWSSKKQPIVALSTTEAEFVAACSAACQAVWLKKLVDELRLYTADSTELFCDNSSAIKLAHNPILHGRSKHIQVRFHYLRELVKAGNIKMSFCGTKDQVADVFTKALSKDSFCRLRTLLGVCKIPE